MKPLSITCCLILLLGGWLIWHTNDHLREATAWADYQDEWLKVVETAPLCRDFADYVLDADGTIEEVIWPRGACIWDGIPEAKNIRGEGMWHGTIWHPGDEGTLIIYLPPIEAPITANQISDLTVTSK